MAVTWLKEGGPPLPYFEDANKVAAVAGPIKRQMLSYLQHGVDTVLRLRHRSDLSPGLVLAAVLAQKYGAVYWITRAEAKVLAQELDAHGVTDDDMAACVAFLEDDHNGQRVYNAAVVAFLKASFDSGLLRFTHFSLPKNAFYADRDGRYGAARTGWAAHLLCRWFADARPEVVDAPTVSPCRCLIRQFNDASSSITVINTVLVFATVSW